MHLNNEKQSENSSQTNATNGNLMLMPDSSAHIARLGI